MCGTARGFLVSASIVTVLGCVSAVQVSRQKESLEAVQLACEQKDGRARTDGWGAALIIHSDPSRGTLVASLGRDKTADRPLEEYWDPSVCNMAASLDADIVCVNGRMRQWPELNVNAQRRLLKLPLECDPYAVSGGSDSGAAR